MRERVWIISAWTKVTMIGGSDSRRGEHAHKIANIFEDGSLGSSEKSFMCCSHACLLPLSFTFCLSLCFGLLLSLSLSLSFWFSLWLRLLLSLTLSMSLSLSHSLCLLSVSFLKKEKKYIYIYVYADESNNGTLFSQKQVKQRDARTLNNGTRPVSRYKNSGFALFWV